MAFTKQRKGSGGSTYFTAHIAIAENDYQAVPDPISGKPQRFKTKPAAQKAADAAQRDYDIKQAVTTQAHVSGAAVVKESPLFEDYAEDWFARLEGTEDPLAEWSVSNYRSYIECHLGPAFAGKRLNEIDEAAIAKWVRSELNKGNKASSVTKWRGTLSTMLKDAAREELITRNPAEKPRGRGPRDGRNRRDRSAEGVATLSALDALHIAERAALLADGRDDEFVMETLRRYGGLRGGELFGLELQYVRPARVRVEWQLGEVRGKRFRTIPKDGSRRFVDLPPFLDAMLADHIERTDPQPCKCHGFTYVFTGRSYAGLDWKSAGDGIADVARLAGVAESTVRKTYWQPERVSPRTRAKVLDAAAELDFKPPLSVGRYAHYWRETYRSSIYVPAATGVYPNQGAKDPEHPVRVDEATFPGIPLKNAMACESEGFWLAITTDPRPHWNRHSHSTDLEEWGTPRVLRDSRIGHADGSVAAIYNHVTGAMVDQLMERLEAQFWEAVDARLAEHPRSPVAVLDNILQARQKSLERVA
ncbi:LacI family DNA-binding transcriptional regulator [Nocardia vinacea]|uniref:LacI family DNA-binding transcriptional regulator n=1 Tax=Nocardia vinacea TaxID=96468 RepID=UPI0033C0A5B3